MMTDIICCEYFKNSRITMEEKYWEPCENNRISYFDFKKVVNYNVYKYAIFDSFERVRDKKIILTKFKPTSPVFAEHVVNRSPLLSYGIMQHIPHYFTK